MESEIVVAGDLAWPHDVVPQSLRTWTEGTPLVANLEGPVATTARSRSYPHTSRKALAQLANMGLTAVSTVNNHFNDDLDDAARTCKLLDSTSLLAASGESPSASVHVGGREVVVLAMGWRPNGSPRTRSGLDVGAGRRRYLRAIRAIRSNRPDAYLIAYPHWNYELEAAPQPLHRVYARELCRSGVDAVIGHHPHVLGGFEKFYGRPVFYSLGNFLFDGTAFYGGRLRFPDATRKQGLVRIDTDTDQLQFRSAVTHPTGELAQMADWLDPEVDPHLQESSTYVGLADQEYVRWFRHHRHQRKALPIFSHRDPAPAVLAKEHFVRLRQPLVRALRRVHHR